MIPTMQLGGALRARWHAPQGDGTDPYFADVTLLLHGNGSNGGTTFTDSSSAARSITNTGNVVTSTGQVKYGSASIYFDGTGDYLTASYTTDGFRWWDEDFTIEAWIYPVSLASMQATSSIPGMCGNASAGASSAYWAFGPMANGLLQFFYWTGAERTIASSASVTESAWNHVAFTHKLGSGMKLWVNGVGTTSYASINGTPQDSTGTPFIIGSAFGGDINAYVDDFRVTKGVERYTANFTPPTSEFPDT